MKSTVIFKKKKKKKKRKRKNNLMRGVIDDLKPSHGPQLRIQFLREGWGCLRAYKHPFVGTVW